MGSESTVRCLVEAGKNKLRKVKLNDSRSLLKPTLLRVSSNSWKRELKQPDGIVQAKRQCSRVREDKSVPKSIGKLSLHNPELLMASDYLESLYDSDSFSGDDLLASSNSAPYIYRGTYKSLFSS